MTDLVYLADRVGVSSGYLPIFNMLLVQARIDPVEVRIFSVYRRYPQYNWVIPFANRKSPTWNPAHRERYAEILEILIDGWRPKVIVTADPASLWLTDADPSFATLDVLRGGVYEFSGVKVVVTLPITAWHQQVKEKDIAAANKGFTDKEEYESFYSTSTDTEADGSADNDENEDVGESEDESSDQTADDVSSRDKDSDAELTEKLMFYTPLIVPYGRFVLTEDMKKAGRLLHGKKAIV